MEGKQAEHTELPALGEELTEILRDFESSVSGQPKPLSRSLIPKALPSTAHWLGREEYPWANIQVTETYAPHQPGPVVSEVVQAGVTRMLDRMDSLAASLRETTAAVRALQERLSEVEQRLASQPVVCQVTIHDLDSDQYSLRQPVCITVEEYEEETIARFPEIEAYASADTEAEAISLLKSEIVSLYEDLLQTDYDELGRRPRAWLRLLEALIKGNEHPQRQA